MTIHDGGFDRHHFYHSGNVMNENSLFILVSEGPDKDWIRKDAGPITSWWSRPSRLERSKRWVSENLSPGRWIAEKVSPEFAEQMDVLRSVHEQVENWTKDLSNALDKAQDARKLGKPLDSIFWLGQINNRLKLVADEKTKLQDVQDKHLEEYFQTHEENIPDDYFETGKHKIVEAGMLDDLGRQLTTWKFQRAHRNRLKEQDVALKKLLGLAKAAVGRTYALLKDMSVALGTGDIAHYLQSLEKVGKQQASFEAEFRSIYDRYFAAMVERIRAKKKEEAERAKKIKEDAEQRERDRLQQMQPQSSGDPSIPVTFDDGTPSVPTVPSLDLPAAQPPQTSKSPEPSKPPQSSVVIDVSSPSSQDLPMSKMPVSKPPETQPSTERKLFEESPAGREAEWERRMKKKKVDEPPPTTRSKASTEMEQMILKMNHAKFQQELEKAAAAGKDPYFLAAMMLKYSEAIDEVDPQKSLELLSIAEGILNG